MNPKKKRKEKKKIENKVVRWRYMEEARRLEAQVMAGGEGLQANQASSGIFRPAMTDRGLGVSERE